MESLQDQSQEMPNKFSVKMEYSGSTQATHNFGMYEYFSQEVIRKWPGTDVIGMIRHDLTGWVQITVNREDGE